VILLPLYDHQYCRFSVEATKEPFSQFVHVHYSRVHVNLICVFAKFEVVSCQNTFDNLYSSNANFLKRSSRHSLLPCKIIINELILVLFFTFM
jgi:hypothetical protein